MIRSVLNDPNEKKNMSIDEEKVNLNIQALNEAMKETLSKKEVEKMDIKPEDVSKMKKLVPILDALEEGITLLGGEKYSTGSAVLPWEKKFEKILEEDEDDPLYIMKFKEDMRHEMKTRCDNNFNRRMLAKASFVDKRFEKLKFLDKDEQKEVIEEVKREMEEIEEKVQEENQNNEEVPPRKKKRVLGYGLSDSESDDEDGGKTTVERELKKYQDSPKLKSFF